MKITAIIERGNDGTYDAYIDSDKDYNIDFGLLGQGKTVQEAIDDFYSGFDEMKEFSSDARKEYDFVFKYDVPSFLSYYSKTLTLAGLERITGVNQGQLSHYVTGHRKPSKKTVQKIETSLHSFARQLEELSFV